MKKAFIFLILFLTVSVSLFSQNAPTLAPLNPDFVRFMNKVHSGKAPLPGTAEFGTGAMPPPGIVYFDNYLENNKLKSVTFDPMYDLRTQGLVTPVKGQTDNACWAFATMASVESQWLKSRLGTWDLSENNLKYCHGFVFSRNENGNHWMSTAYFARRSGPLVEGDDPNAKFSACPAGKTPVGYITDARYLPNNMAVIKQAILDQGAIFTMMYFSGTYFNSTNNTYYRGDSADVNHAVDLVGWDDTKITAGGTGAWICKNSYGTGWGEAGYFYVSYYDKCILDYNAYWPVRDIYKAEDFVYGYDELGNYGADGYGNDVGYILVKFTASAPQKLSKVGTYAMASGETMEIDIFSDFNPTTLVLSGLLSHTGGISCLLPGYYTSDLATTVSVKPGDDFYVRVRYYTPGVGYQIPTEYAIAGYSSPKIEKDIAWMSGTGADNSWYLIGSSNTNPNFQMDPCVKVYAEPWVSWTGIQGADWSASGNWSNNMVPDYLQDIVIPDVVNDPVINQPTTDPAVCNNLIIQSGAKLTIAKGKALTVNGTLTNNAGSSGLIVESGASLITKGDITGTATVKRDITGNKWHFISPPVSDAVSGVFTGKYLQTHTESTNAYTYITSVDEPLIPLKGYALWSTADFTASYTGLLNTGLNSISLTRTSDDLFNSGWNLAGNPYPSSIDWDAASGWNKYNVNSTIYIEKDGDWATYIGGTGSTPGEGTNGGTRFIAPGQGFFVSAASVGDATLAMDDRVRVHNATEFFKNSDAGSLVRLKISGNRYSDEAVVRLMPEATAEYDPKYDAVKLFGTNNESAQMYTLGGASLTINSLPSGTVVVPLGIHAGKTAKYTIAATENRNQDKIILEDTKTGLITPLSSKPYSFIFETGEKELRFNLYFNGSMGTGPDKAENSFASVYSYNQMVHINLNEQVKGDISIYTMGGQLVAAKPSASGMNSFSLPGNSIYIVKVITQENTMVKKVWIQ